MKKLIVFNSISKRGVPFYNMCYIYYKTLPSSIDIPYPFQFYHKLSCYEVAIETPPNANFQILVNDMYFQPGFQEKRSAFM